MSFERRKVLRLLNRDLYFNAPTDQVILSDGKTILDSFMLDGAVHVEDKPETRNLLASKGQSFIPGTIRTYNRDFFFRDEPELCKQLVFKGPKDILGIKIPTALGADGKPIGLDSQINIITSLIEKHRFFRKFEVSCEAFLYREKGVHSIELFHRRWGRAPSLILNHSEFGAAKLVVHHNSSENCYEVLIMPKYQMLKLDLGI